jgi:hypothetical protein
VGWLVAEIAVVLLLSVILSVEFPNIAYLVLGCAVGWASMASWDACEDVVEDARTKKGG